MTWLIAGKKLSETNESMGRCLRELGGGGDSSRLSHILQRHRELLHEYEKECRKIKSNIKEQRERCACCRRIAHRNSVTSSYYVCEIDMISA